MKSDYLTTTRFAEFDLNSELHAALEAAKLEFCTEIQLLSLPLMLDGQDIAAQSQTGTGKTAAFLLGMYQQLLNNPIKDDGKPTDLRALVLAPTRELAIQIHKDAVELRGESGLRLALAYGGMDYEKQRRQIQEGADVLIGTPGRIIDYFKQKVFSLKRCEVVVLDEADRMFDLGFISDIRYLLRRMPDPTERLNLLFSATLSHRVMELAYEHMNNPVDLKSSSDRIAAEKVEQRIYHPSSEEKIPLLLGMLRSMRPQRCIVFVNTKRAAEKVHDYLNANDESADVLSGDVRQNKRQRLIENLTAGNLTTLIATDVAARGLHVEGVTHVFNYDLPQHAEDYVHRIGRTARAGASGLAISFACEEYVFSLPEIEELLGHEITSTPITEDLLVEPNKPARPSRRRSSGGRNSSRGGKPGGGAGRGGSGNRSNSSGNRNRRRKSSKPKAESGNTSTDSTSG